MQEVASSASRLGTFSSHPQWEVSVHPACRRNARSKTRQLHSPIPKEGASNPLPQLVWDQTTASSFRCANDSVKPSASSHTHLLISIYTVTLCIQRIYFIFFYQNDLINSGRSSRKPANLFYQKNIDL